MSKQESKDIWHKVQKWVIHDLIDDQQLAQFDIYCNLLIHFKKLTIFLDSVLTDDEKRFHMITGNVAFIELTNLLATQLCQNQILTPKIFSF